ncbi:MAG: MMPL family transporter [Chloroflexia bacterium]|nr:MMPL family transporter [Chloroflexia bacterium]
MNIGSISRFVLRHKAWVASFWLAVTVASVALMPWVFDNLSESFDMPGSESADMAMETSAIYGNDGAFAPLVMVVTLPEGQSVDSARVRDEWLALESTVVAAEPSARLVSWATTGDPAFVSDDGRTVFGLVYFATDGFAPRGLAEARESVEDATIAGAPVLLTGRPVLESEFSGEAEGEGGGGALVETLIGGVGALVVLLYIFGSALALTPLIIAAVSILTSFLIIGGLTTVMDINSIVQFLVALVGLGVAIDYALLVVRRWREERLAGNPNELAVQRAMETAGHAVVFSGTTVGIGLVALIAVPVPFFRGMGVGGMVIPLASVLVTITLLPVILATIGPAMDRVGLKKKAENHRGWERWAAFVVRHRGASAVVGLVLLALLIIPATQIAIGTPRPDSLNSSGEPRIGLETLESSGIDAGVVDPLTILVHGDPAPVVEAVAGLDGVRGAVAPDNEQWRQDGTGLVAVIPQSNGESADGRDVTRDVRAAVDGLAGDPLVGGGPARSADFVGRVYGGFPLMILMVAVVTYVLLVRAFRSLLLPLKALFLNVLSVAAAYGVLVVVWQWGWGSELIWGIESTGAITDWIPIMIFAFLFGLSMDYEVFILHRMREEHDGGHGTDLAIVRGLAFTGKLVTCAALILFLAFVAMSSTPETEIKIMATGLAAGIIIDATVIRAFLVPALTSLMGKWNWWLPRGLQWFAPQPAAITQASPAPASTLVAGPAMDA